MWGDAVCWAFVQSYNFYIMQRAVHICVQYACGAHYLFIPSHKHLTKHITWWKILQIPNLFIAFVMMRNVNGGKISRKVHSRRVGCIDCFGRWTNACNKWYETIYPTIRPMQMCIQPEKKKLYIPIFAQQDIMCSGAEYAEFEWALKHARRNVCVACGVCITNIQVSIEIFTAIRVCRTPKCYAWRTEIHGFDRRLMSLWRPDMIGEEKKMPGRKFVLFFAFHFLFM